MLKDVSNANNVHLWSLRPSQAHCPHHSI